MLMFRKTKFGYILQDSDNLDLTIKNLKKKLINHMMIIQII